MVRNWITRLALLTSSSLACAAPPTSTVEIYGRLDLSVNTLHYSNHGNATYLSSDSSLWGLRGSEDLGSGQRAYFKLESWFDASTGSQVVPSQVFSREVYVGWGSDSAGSIQLGSQYAGGFWLSVRADPFLRSNTGPFLSLLQRSPTNTRGFSGAVNNSVQYVSPKVHGLSARMLFAPSESSAGNFSSASVEYADRNLWAGLAYETGKVAAATVGATGEALAFSNTSAGFTYNMNVLKLHGYVLSNRIKSAPHVWGAMLGATIPMGTGDFRVAYTKQRTNDVANSSASLASVGYFYPLSKRTTLYTSIARLNNHGQHRFNIYPASMDAGLAPTAAAGVSAMQFGMRHTF